jgi:hypothetical protein
MGITSWNYFLIVLSLSSSIRAFYLPGLAPNVFCRNAIQDSKCKVCSIEKKTEAIFIEIDFF